MVNVADTIAALVLLALAAAAWFGSGPLPAEAASFPRLVAVLMGLLAAAMLARSLAPVITGRGRREEQPFFKHFPTFLACLALILSYIFTVSQIGYFSATVVFVPLFAVVLGLRRPVLIALTTACFIAAVYLVFVESFSRPLPVEFFNRY
ncbi:MAG: tripartite tricarboxylate transporter TctB family protein [Acetobacterales bacterium]